LLDRPFGVVTWNSIDHKVERVYASRRWNLIHGKLKCVRASLHSDSLSM
jgi:hypothetical protein